MSKKILLLGELYRPLIPWFLHDEAPQGVPAVYNLYRYLGNSTDFQFHSIIFNPEVEARKVFPNGSILELKKFSFPIYYIWKFLVLFKLYGYGKKLIQNQKFDLIYGLSTFSLVAALLGRKSQIPSVARIYGTILTKDVKEKNYGRLYTRFLFDIAAIKFPADQVICTLDGTDYDKVFYHFNKNLHQQPILLYNGMEKSLRNKLLHFPLVTQFQNKTKFCYIARLEPYKRQDIAIEVIDILVNTYHWEELLLTIIGTGSQTSYLKELVVEKGLEKYIDFIAEMPHEEVINCVKVQDAAFFFYEGGSLGNVLWECALGGKLIVTVDNGGTGNLFKDGVNSIISSDSKLLAKETADKLAQLRGKSFGEMTSGSRRMVAALISSWENRFDREFKEIIEWDS